MIHRIVGVDATGNLLLKGDAVPHADGWISADAVVATVDGAPTGRAPVAPRWRRALRRLARAREALLDSGDAR